MPVLLVCFFFHKNIWPLSKIGTIYVLQDSQRVEKMSQLNFLNLILPKVQVHLTDTRGLDKRQKPNLNLEAVSEKLEEEIMY